MRTFFWKVVTDGALTVIHMVLGTFLYISSFAVLVKMCSILLTIVSLCHLLSIKHYFHDWFDKMIDFYRLIILSSNPTLVENAALWFTEIFLLCFLPSNTDLSIAEGTHFKMLRLKLPSVLKMIKNSVINNKYIDCLFLKLPFSFHTSRLPHKIWISD